MRSPLAALLVVAFTLSGFLGLVYEVLWVRWLTLLFGATSLAITTVIGAFFGGMALGSFVFGRLAQRTRNCVRLFALLEIGVGAYALGFPLVLGFAEDLYRLTRANLGGTGVGLHTVRILVGFALLLMPTALMGGTLPVLARHFVRSRSALAARIGGLYAVNTLGAAAGAFVTGYVLIGNLGLSTTNYLAGALNIILGAAAWMLGAGARLPRAAPSEAPAGEGTATEKGACPTPAEPGSTPVRFVMVAFGLSGFLAIAYQVVWMRYLSLFLVTTTYAVSAMLTVFLVGLALGSLAAARFLDRRIRPLVDFGALQLAIGMSVLVMTPLLLGLGEPRAADPAQLIRGQFLLCFALMLLPTALMGVVFPLVSRMVVQRADRVASSLGTAQAVNTAGTVLGAFGAGLLLLPTLGIGGSLLLLALGSGALGLFAFVVESAPGRSGRVAAGAVALAMSLVFWFRTPPIPRARLEQLAGPGREIVALAEGLTGTVWVAEEPNRRKSLWINTSIMGRTQRPGRREPSAQRVQGHLPLVLRPGRAQSVLGIGFGTGQTFAAQLLHPIGRLEAVDLSRTVVELATSHFQDQLGGLESDDRVRIVVDDGRGYVDAARESYDVVTLEMPPHMESGIVHFYTREFYELLRAHLQADGIVAQWVPIYNLSLSETRNVVRTFLEVFPQASLWFNSANLLLLGSRQEFVLDPEAVRRSLARPFVARDLDVTYTGDDAAALNTLEGILGCFLMGPSALQTFAREGDVITDDRPTLEFSWSEFPVWGPGRADLLVLENAEGLSAGVTEIAPYLTLELDPATLERIRTIRASYLNHLFAMSYDNMASQALGRGKVDQAIALYRRAIETQPRFAQAQHNLGTALLEVGRFEEAAEVLQQASWFAPDLEELQFATGVANERLGRVPEAIDGYRAAISLRSTFVEPYLNLARLQYRVGRVQEAVATLESLVDENPRDPRGRVLLEQLAAEGVLPAVDR